MAQEIFSVDAAPADRAEGGGSGDPPKPPKMIAGGEDPDERKPARCKRCGARMTLFEMQHHTCDPAVQAAAVASDPTIAAEVARVAVIGAKRMAGQSVTSSPMIFSAAEQAADALLAMFDELQNLPPIPRRAVVYTTINTAMLNFPPASAAPPAPPIAPPEPLPVPEDPEPAPGPYDRFYDAIPAGEDRYVCNTRRPWRGVGELR